QRRQIFAYEPFKLGAIQPNSSANLLLRAQLICDNARNKVILRSEVGIKGPVREACVRHQSHEPRSTDAVALESSSRTFDDAPTRSVLVLAVIPRHRANLSRAIASRPVRVYSLEHHNIMVNI